MVHRLGVLSKVVCLVLVMGVGGLLPSYNSTNPLKRSKAAKQTFDLQIPTALLNCLHNFLEMSSSCVKRYRDQC